MTPKRKSSWVNRPGWLIALMGAVVGSVLGAVPVFLLQSIGLDQGQSLQLYLGLTIGLLVITGLGLLASLIWLTGLNWTALTSQTGNCRAAGVLTRSSIGWIGVIFGFLVGAELAGLTELSRIDTTLILSGLAMALGLIILADQLFKSLNWDDVGSEQTGHQHNPGRWPGLSTWQKKQPQPSRFRFRSSEPAGRKRKGQGIWLGVG